MHTHRYTLSATLACFLFACSAPTEDDGEGSIESEYSSSTRIVAFVSEVLPAAELDGRDGLECAAKLTPEVRAREVLLVQQVDESGACPLAELGVGEAVSFTWAETKRYGISSGIAKLREAFASEEGAVHRLTGDLTSEAANFAKLQAFLATPAEEQGEALLAHDSETFQSVRLHSLHDFQGEAEEHAENAYQAVRVKQYCENPGTPKIEARVADGFVYGYVASNSGSCHSGWFSSRHTYGRDWAPLAQENYSE